MWDGRDQSKVLMRLALRAWLCALPGAAAADIYKYVDKHGVVHLSDRNGGAGWVLISRAGKKIKRPASLDYRQNQRRYAGLIDQVARKYRLDRALVHAVIKAESAYDANAISKKGAVGLMQLMPGTAQRYGVRDRYNPRPERARRRPLPARSAVPLQRRGARARRLQRGRACGGVARQSSAPVPRDPHLYPTGADLLQGISSH